MATTTNVCTHEHTDSEFVNGLFTTYCLNCFETLKEQTFRELYHEVFLETMQELDLPTCEGSWKDANSCILHTEEDGYFNA